MLNRVLVYTDPDDYKKLHRRAKSTFRKGKAFDSTEVILGIQTMKRVALDWEAATGQRCEGLAATQIGWDQRVVILRKTDDTVPPKPGLISLQDSIEEIERWTVAKARREEFDKTSAFFDPWYVLINPVVHYQDGEQESIEGCLSVPNCLYKVKRPEVVMFRYYTPTGQHLSKVAQNFSACSISHEIDHLDGVLISDRATEAAIIGTTDVRL